LLPLLRKRPAEPQSFNKTTFDTQIDFPASFDKTKDLILWMDKPSSMPFLPNMTSRKVASIALLVAAALSTDYALLGVPNVKLMDTLVFLGGYMFGLDVGASVAVLSWLVYGTLNPQGAATPGLLAVLMASECIYAVGGWALRKISSKTAFTGIDRVKFGFVGFVTAAIYDFATNAYTGIFYYPGYSMSARIIRALIFGVPFAIIHETTDSLLFAVIAPTVITVLGRRIAMEVKVKGV
jgi:hypothetical protein